MIEWVALFVAFCLLFFACVSLFVLRYWVCTFLISCIHNVRALFPQHVHAEIKTGTIDVLVIFSDPSFPRVDLSHVIQYFEHGVELYYANINYNLLLTAEGHALQALGSIDEKRGIRYYFDQHPAKRFTFLGLGVGGFIAAYCAQRMPQYTNVYLATNFQKNRVRTLLVGTPIHGCRPFYNFAIAPFTYKPEICDMLVPESTENTDFWIKVDVLHHVYILRSKNDIRCAPSQQDPPPLFKRYIEINTVRGTPWYGLLT